MDQRRDIVWAIFLEEMAALQRHVLPALRARDTRLEHSITALGNRKHYLGDVQSKKQRPEVRAS